MGVRQVWIVLIIHGGAHVSNTTSRMAAGVTSVAELASKLRLSEPVQVSPSHPQSTRRVADLVDVYDVRTGTWGQAQVTATSTQTLTGKEHTPRAGDGRARGCVPRIRMSVAQDASS